MRCAALIAVSLCHCVTALIAGPVPKCGSNSTQPGCGHRATETFRPRSQQGLLWDGTIHLPGCQDHGGCLSDQLLMRNKCGEFLMLMFDGNDRWLVCGDVTTPQLRLIALMPTHRDTQRHTDTQTHRHTDTQTHRHTDTKTHRHTDTDTQTKRHTQSHTHTQTSGIHYIQS